MRPPITLLMLIGMLPFAVAAQPCPGTGHGKLLVHGGGGNADAYVRVGLEACRGVDTRVALVLYAGGDPFEAGEEAREKRERAVRRWTDFGATRVSVIDLRDPERAIADIEAADYVFFGGGSQSGLMGWLRKYPTVLEAIRERRAAGALIGGTSAGAAVMSASMIVGGDSADLKSVRAGGTRIGEGLGFWPEVIVDQHFLARQRWARLVSAVLDAPQLPGVAIDERTAVLVDGSSFEVLGDGSVVVFDGRDAEVPRTEDGRLFQVGGLRMHLLRAGDRFNLAEITH